MRCGGMAAWMNGAPEVRCWRVDILEVSSTRLEAYQRRVDLETWSSGALALWEARYRRSGREGTEASSAAALEARCKRADVQVWR